MKFVVLLLFAPGMAIADTGASSEEAAVTPVQKVMQLMNQMLAKGKEDKQAEAVQYGAFKQFCEDVEVEKRNLIKEANSEIVMLKAEIEKLTSEIEALGLEIQELDGNIALWTSDIEAAAKVRKKEKKDYVKLHKDYSESVDALDRAIKVLKKQDYTRKQSSSLLQVSALKDLSLIPEEAKRSLDAFLSEGEQDLEILGQPEALGYEFQSDGIISMLQKLYDKFQRERTRLEKDEMNSKTAFELLSQDLEAQIKRANQDRSEKIVTKAKKGEKKAKTEADLSDTIEQRDADKKYLKDLVANCEKKAGQFEARDQLRAEELEAIEQAIAIVGSQAVKGNAEKHLPSMVQASGLALISMMAEDPETTRIRLTAYLQEQAKELDSRVLSTVAAHAEIDQFVKVRQLIRDLITRLLEEANEEAEHKAWCDTELATNAQTRKAHSEAVAVLSADVDLLEAELAKIAERIPEIEMSIKAVTRDMRKATELRGDEKLKNNAVIKDSQEAQSALANALAILRDFYAKAADAVALTQEQPKSPEIFGDDAYKGMTGRKGGVVGMLEVVETDFERLEAETQAAEDAAQKEYDEFMTDSAEQKAKYESNLEYKLAKQKRNKEELAVKAEDLQETQDSQNSALAYYDKLKPSCVNAGVDHKERIARRQGEIQSLKEALQILNGEAIA